MSGSAENPGQGNDKDKDTPVDPPVPPRRMDPRLRMVTRHLARLIDGLDPAIQDQVQQTLDLLVEADFRPGPGGVGRRCPVCGRPANGSVNG
jgi:hypothetical protein